MFWTNTKRVFRLGLINFARNSSVSAAAVLVMIIALLVISSLIFTRALLYSTLGEIQDKVGINVYFIPTAEESDILDFKDKVSALPEVASAVYSSADDQLAAFKVNHQNDALTLQALDEVGSNPLGAMLSIQAKDPTQYDSINSFLQSQENASSNSIIDKINYQENKVAIDTLNRIIVASKKLGIAIASCFALLAILIVFNTIRLGIYMARDEISVMRLVGASTRYIKAPFVINGFLYGVTATVISLVLLLPLSYWAGPYTLNLGTGINVFNFYLANILEFAGVLLLSSFVIGGLSSYLAVKKYLKI